MTAKGEATRKGIVKAARRLFRLQGYTKTSIEDICSEAGVTRGTLYFYFKSKEELAETALDESTERHISFFITLMEDELDPITRIEMLIDGIVGYYSVRGEKAS